MTKELFNFDASLPPKANIPKFRDKLSSINDSVGPDAVITEEFIQQMVGLFGNVLDYIDLLEQDIFDLKVILSTTVEHSTAIENLLSNQTEQISNRSEKYEFIVNSSVDWMAVVNRNYCYEAVNESLATEFGKTSAQMIGKSLARVWGAEFFKTHMKASVDTCFEGKEVREHILCALPRHGAKYDNNGGSDSFQNVCALPGSQEKWCEFSYTPYRNHLNEITHVVCIARDISASRQAETLLREHTLYLDQVSDAIMVIGMDQKIYYWNKSAERIYGWKREQVIDKKKIEAIMPNPEKLETILAIMGEVGSWRGEMVHCTKARKEVAVSSIWTLIHTRQNESFILITNTDITEKKLLEQQFLRIQRMEGIGSVASGIAHDLNNVLSALFMSIRLLKPKCTDEKSVQILDLLDNSAKRGVNLVRQILEFARGIEGNELVIPIPQIVSEVREFVQSTFPKSIEMNAKISADLWTVVGNPTQIHQVMLNLCVNARDAMQGGGRLTVTAENFAVHERDRTKVPESLSSGTYVQIQVIDTGVGIPKQLIGKIFDPFFTTKEKGKGTGLGLSTVQTIVKNHGGFMEVKSKPNIGTEFTIYLPATLQVPGQQSSEGMINFQPVRVLGSPIGKNNGLNRF